MIRVFVLDNYDSFTFNLVQYLGAIGVELSVKRNDELTVEDVLGSAPDGVLISPGPGLPADAGICIPLVEACAANAVPVLGVCLGHQAIGEAFGSRTVHAPSLMHGKTSMVTHDSTGLFEDIPSPFEATRYHSLCVERATLGSELVVNAHTDGDVIMGMRHSALPIHGVQFHPESILTEHGMDLLRNWVRSL